jgi:choline-sulfatase
MSPQPNILFLFTDQQRFDTIAALGNPIIKTPTLDRLVREGTTFTDCYTPTPVCVAARSALLTGLPAHVTGCADNTAMQQDRPSLMQRLSELGYQTAGIGKMHFTPDPHFNWGFEHRVFSEEGTHEGDAFRAFLDANGYGHVQDMQGVRGEYYYIPQPSQLPAHLHHTHWTADQSIEFLHNRDRSRPFFLWTSFIKPHPPFESPTPWNKLYRAPEMPRPFRPNQYDDLLNFWNRVQNRYKYRDAGTDDNLYRTMRAAYYGCISFIDWNIGRILTALGDEIDNTLIVFSSDHGELLGDYGSVGKRTMLDPSVRVPMIARLPQQFSAGAQLSTPVTLLDLWPTFLQAAGADDIYSSAEGESLQRVVDGSSKRQHVFSQFSQSQFGLYMVTDGRYKYIYSAADEQEWLFDRHVDPQETHNFAYNLAYAATTATLRQAIINRYARDDITSAVCDGKWRRYGKQTLPDDPDYGLLYQDTPDLQASIDALGEGYARTVTVPDDVSYQLIFHTMNYESD